MRAAVLGLMRRFPRAALLALWGAHALHLALGSLVMAIAAWPIAASTGILGAGENTFIALIGAGLAIVMAGVHAKLAWLMRLVLPGPLLIWLSAWAMYGEASVQHMVLFLFVLAVANLSPMLDGNARNLPWMWIRRHSCAALLTRLFPEVSAPLRADAEASSELKIAVALALARHGVAPGPRWSDMVQAQMSVCSAVVVGWLCCPQQQAQDERDRLETSLREAAASAPRARL